MGNTYLLPQFGNLIIFKNFYILEIYSLLLVGILLILFLRKISITKLIFVILSVILYKLLNDSLFGGNCCTLQNSYYPSLDFVNLLFGIIKVAEVLFGILIVNLFIKKDSLKFIGAICGSFFLGIIDEIIIKGLGIRVYGQDINNLLSGNNFLGIPFETYIYIFVGTVLIFGIYDYLNKIILEKTNIVHKQNIYKYILFAILPIFLTEIIIHPIFLNKGLPTFTYIYQDINWLIISISSIFLGFIVYLFDIILLKKVTLRWFEKGILFVLIFGIFEIIIYSILWNNGNLSFATSHYLWGISLFGIPIEAINIILLKDIIILMFMRRTLIKFN